MPAYYNEIDRRKAASLRELIKAKLIAPGEVDERSIEDVKPDELRGFQQCHFFAGVGVWSYALRLAGWPDDRSVWTGSCPCPSFSAAGKGEGFEDARHLWPAWYRLIEQSAPATIFGEQVAAAIRFGWLDLVQTDLEASAYSFGKIVLGAHSVGAPHIRQRLFFVADSKSIRCQRSESRDLSSPDNSQSQYVLTDSRFKRGSAAGERAYSNGRNPARERLQRGGEFGLRAEDGCGDGSAGVGEQSEAGTHNDAISNGRRKIRNDDSGNERLILNPEGEIVNAFDTEQPRLERQFGNVREWRGPGWLDPDAARSAAAAGATRGYWSDCDGWYGKDGKYRPIGPGIFPLAHGAPERVGRLSCYGDAIVAQAAQAFIESYIETLTE